MQNLSSLVDDNDTSAFIVTRRCEDCFFRYTVQEQCGTCLEVVEVDETELGNYD